MRTQEQRGDQMFPVLDAARAETALRFASGRTGGAVIGSRAAR